MLPRIPVSLVRTLIATLGTFLVLASCQPAGTGKVARPFSVAVYVTGVTQGSPTFEQMVQGIEEAMNEIRSTQPEAVLKIVEGGYNQGEWQNGIMALAATEAYDLIVTSNPSMPEYCAVAADSYPDQKFLILDAALEGHPRIKTIAYDQYQQGWLNGHMAGLITRSGMKGANPELRIGILAGQEYPVMNEEIRVGFLDGARAVDPGISLDFRVLGNWYDASKAEIIARDMIAQGVDVILTIAGSANQGVVAAARDLGTYVAWFDSSAYSQAPGIIVSSSLVRQTAAAKNAVLLAAAGSLDYGRAEVLGIADGAVGFDAVSADFTAHVATELVEAQQDLLEGLASGSVPLPRK